MKAPSDLIFVVDDSEMFLTVFTRYLKKYNYEVKGFSNGLKMLGDLYLQPKAILIDYYLDSNDKSAMNGGEIFGIIRLLKGKCPVIVFSSQCPDEKIEEIKELGVHGFISKDSKDFFENISSLLGRIIT